MTDFDHLGTDGVLDARLGMVSGRELLAADLLARLMEDPGGLYYSERYGAGLGLSLNDDVDANGMRKLEGIVEDHCRRDERVRSARCTASFVESTDELKFSLVIEDNEGPFPLVFQLGATAAVTSGVPPWNAPAPWNGWDGFWVLSGVLEEHGIFDRTFDRTFQ